MNETLPWEALLRTALRLQVYGRIGERWLKWYGRRVLYSSDLLLPELLYCRGNGYGLLLRTGDRIAMTSIATATAVADVGPGSLWVVRSPPLSRRADFNILATAGACSCSVWMMATTRTVPGSRGCGTGYYESCVRHHCRVALTYGDRKLSHQLYVHYRCRFALTWPFSWYEKNIVRY